MDKIRMDAPIVEMGGDEMAAVLWKLVKDELITPFIDLKSEYFDLSLKNRNATGDSVTRDAAEAVKKSGVGVKCATIPVTRSKIEEYDLKSPLSGTSVTIKGILDATVFRTPIATGVVSPAVKNWTSPITIARHSYGDMYNAVEIDVPSEGTAFLSFKGEDGTEIVKKINDFDGKGVLRGQFNTDESIRSFAYSCFSYALETKKDLWFSAKDNISKKYDIRFKNIFEEVYEKSFRERFEAAGIKYCYFLIDEAVSKAVKSHGGFVWALKNYDGDVLNDMIAAASGALSLVSSVMVSPDGNFVYETAHGTMPRLFAAYNNGESTSADSIQTVFAWTGALRRRAQMDKNAELFAFADKMEIAVMKTLSAGYMTEDIAQAAAVKDPTVLSTDDFVLAVRKFFEDGKDESGEAIDMEFYDSFLDCRSYKRKIEILKASRAKLTDKIITDFAVSLDVVVDEGDIDIRYASLLSCLNQMAKFETEGLR